MSVTKRIFGVLSCLLMYAGAVALDLYNAARYKEVAYLNGEHLYTNWYSVYGIPEVHCIDGFDIFYACIWPMMLMMPLFLYFAVRRDRVSGWHKILLWYGSSFFICQFIRNIWITTQEFVPEIGFVLFLVLQALYIMMLLLWPFINMFTAKRVG